MLSPLRNRFGIPGVISVIALVFAMFGGAYAATNDGGSGSATASAKKNNKKKKQGGLNGKQKNQVRNISKQEARKFANSNPGAPGAPGPQGPAGPPGANGNDGQNGQNGADGDDGVDGDDGATGATGPEGPEGLEGEEGSPWTVGGTLPSGETVTGTWAYADADAGVKAVPISFTIPLAAAISSASNVHFVAVGDPAPAGCTGGTAAAPAADAGHICVYAGAMNSTVPSGPASAGGIGTIRPAGTLSTGTEGTGTSGAILGLIATATFGNAQGTWAVTAP